MSEGKLPGGEGESVNQVPGNAGGVGIWLHIFALAVYLAMAVAVTYPGILHFTTSVPGDLLADRDQNLWNLWWVKEALGRGANPFHTDFLYYPYGVNLYYHTLALPLGLIGLLPQVLLGLPAAYNSVLLVGFTLSGYGAFRLGLYSLGTGVNTQKPRTLQVPAAFLGGVVFAFTPYTLDALKGQPEVLSVQWMPLYAEMWLRAMDGDRRWSMVDGRWSIAYGLWSMVGKYAALAGLFLALTAYSSLYYAVYMVIFTVAHLAYRLLAVWHKTRVQSAQKPAQPQEWPLLRYSAPVTLVVAAVTLALTLPLAIGLVADHGNPRLAVAADAQHRLTHSADLLSFVTPPHDHLIFGTWQDQPGVNEPPIHDYVGLGYAALALAIIGSIAGWRASGIRFWASLGLLALVLAMGPELQIDRNLTGIPLPFALLEKVPGMEAIAKPERFVVLARLCMSVLAAVGAVWIAGRPAGGRRRTKDEGRRTKMLSTIVYRRDADSWAWPTFAIIFALLLVELPVHPRYMGEYSIPDGFNVLAHQPAGGIMELPFATQQVDITGQRMLYQTVHDKPIMGGYLARNYNSPIIDSCSPFWGFISPLDVPRQDIASPLVVSRPQDVLNFYGITYIALYAKYGGPGAGAVDPKQMAAQRDIVREVAPGQTLYADDYMSLYRVAPTDVAGAPPSFHIGAGWYSIEQPDGVPFRWVSGGQGTFCVFTPRKVTASLDLEATAFSQEQQITISAGAGQLYRSKLPAGSFTRVVTDPIEWQAGVTEVQVVAGKPGVSPRSLDPASADERLLTIGLRRISLAIDAQK